ncbi:hypothetical protein FACS1894162_2900 [Bacteroidia bacterium]|nr:hypothetical protein FACS1894162_2900 [Bacteroidia bacterium]
MKKIVMCTLLVMAIQWPATGQNVSRALDAAMDLSNASSIVPARTNIARNDSLQILGAPRQCECDEKRFFFSSLKLLVKLWVNANKEFDRIDIEYPANTESTKAWRKYVQKILGCGARANLYNDCGTLRDVGGDMAETIGLIYSADFDPVNNAPPEYKCAAQPF